MGPQENQIRPMGQNRQETNKIKLSVEIAKSFFILLMIQYLCFIGHILILSEHLIFEAIKFKPNKS